MSLILFQVVFTFSIRKFGDSFAKGTVPRGKRRELLVRENTSKRVFRASVKEVDKNDGNT